MTRPASSLIGRLRALRRSRFGRDENGTTAIEFGLLAVPFFTIIGAILETSVVMLASQMLESGVNDASRLIRTGQAQTEKFDEAAFKQNICGRLYAMFGDCDGLRVSVEPIPDFSEQPLPPPLSCDAQKKCDWTMPEKFDAGAGSNTVLVRAYYKWPIIFNFGGFGFSNLADNTRLISAVRVFRNEPF